MEFISFLSSKIELTAIAVSNAILIIFPFLDIYLSESPENIMIIIGFGGQALFAARFLIQWITSESAQRSVIPIAFWYFSITGGIVLLTYAIWRKDPVIIAGQSVGILIYARNLYFIHRNQRSE
tara:strand:+ start:578 stop:949 length:372 start_codon:yes stop_codon:yes gene_type:complete